MNANFKKMLTTALAIAIGVFVFQIVMKALGQGEQKLYAIGGGTQNLPCSSNVPTNICESGCVFHMGGTWNPETNTCTVSGNTAPQYPFGRPSLGAKFFR